jgi:hypothetical protein
MSKEIPMYCCLPFSYAVHYGIIKIDMERIEVKLSLKSSLSEGERKEISDMPGNIAARRVGEIG